MKNSIGITNFKSVAPYKIKLGDPKDWSTFKENADDGALNIEHRLNLLSIKKEEAATPERVVKTEERKPLMNTEATSTPGNFSGYESIGDLYVGLPRWTILCRITRKTLKESTKQGMKILEIELVDKSKKKIIGTFFQEAALKFNDYLEEQRIYEISKGRLREANYNNSKNDMLSPFTLIFDDKSEFKEVSDVNIIVKNEDTAITLGQGYERKVFNQDFDIVAYVVEVKPETTFQKNDKSFVVRDLVVADPEARLTMNARLWRWNQEITNDMVGKVIILSRFTFHDYKGSVSLSSNVRSSIITTHQHPMRSYEGKRVDISGFHCTTEVRERVDENPADFCRNMKELEERISYMREDDTIKSILTVVVSRLAFSRKWCYDACPKCKKMADKYSKCANCDTIIEDTNLNFVLGTELSDFTGSLWVTAYDELSHKIFYDLGKNAARTLQALEKDQLMEISEKYLYQPLKVKLITKKDHEGRVRHVAGHLYELNE